MGPKPYPDYSLDRIDPNGNYEPGNCRWALSSVQARNKRNSRWYEFEGQPALLIDIARYFGISRDQARALLRLGHWITEWTDQLGLNPPSAEDVEIAGQEYAAIAIAA